jgi:ATP synthase F1 gamma subunit
MDEGGINTQIADLTTLQTLTRVYGKVASTRMRKTRDSVLASRRFLEAIDSIFHQVRSSYAREVMALVKGRRGKKPEKITFLAHNGKTVALLLSANTGLYGDIVQRTFDLFIKEVREKGSEATIVGRLGLSLFLETEPNRPYTYFDLPDNKIDREQLAKVTRHLVPYEEIHVYYGKFQNVVNQIPTRFNIAAEMPAAEKPGEAHVKYLFEPSLEEILMFFETEIFASVFEQSVRESQLAKFAARNMAMDKAGENIKKELEKVRLQKLRLRHVVDNRKQLNSLASRIFLRRK